MHKIYHTWHTMMLNNIGASSGPSLGTVPTSLPVVTPSSKSTESPPGTGAPWRRRNAEGLETPPPWPGMEVGDPRTLHHGHALQKQIAVHPLFPGTASGARLTRASPVFPLTSCVTWGKFLNPSVPLFPHLLFSCPLKVPGKFCLIK